MPEIEVQRAPVEVYLSTLPSDTQPSCKEVHRLAPRQGLHAAIAGDRHSSAEAEVIEYWISHEKHLSFNSLLISLRPTMAYATMVKFDVYINHKTGFKAVLDKRWMLRHMDLDDVIHCTLPLNGVSAPTFHALRLLLCERRLPCCP